MNWALKELFVFCLCFFAFWGLGGALLANEWFDIKLVVTPGPLAQFFWYIRQPERLLLLFLLVWVAMLVLLNLKRFVSEDEYDRRVRNELDRVRRLR